VGKERKMREVKAARENQPGLFLRGGGIGKGGEKTAIVLSTWKKKGARGRKSHHHPRKGNTSVEKKKK